MTSAIMGYHPPGGAAVGADSIGPIYDGVYGRIFSGSISASATGWRSYDAFPKGVQILERTNTSVGMPNNAGPICFRGTAQQLAGANAGSNGAALFYLTATELTPQGVFGTVDSSFTNSHTHMESARRSCSIAVGPGGFGLDTVVLSVASTDGVINAVSGLTNFVLGTIDENYAEVGSLPDGSGTNAFIVGYTKLGGATQIGLYQTTTPPGSIGGGIAPLGKITPAQIASDWTVIDTVFGISIDQTDGNPIIALLNLTDAAAHGSYMVKLNKTTAHVIWAIPLGGVNSGVSYQAGMKFNVIKNGRMWYIGTAANTLYQINTVAGTATTQTLSNAALDVLHGDQCSEDVTDSVMWLGSWSEGTTHPSYLGDYMFTQGNHAGSGMIFRYWPLTATPAPVYGIAANSRKRAWSFVMDGHVFYVLDLGQEGTWLYDDSTGYWSRWITQGFNGWNLTNGTMWGVRIVGGDFLTSDIWEMQPGALKDNGTVDIVHVVTGGLIKRTRVYSSCEAVRMNVAVGQLDDTVAATVLLEYSDDQGQTWTSADLYNIAEGAVGDELAWRSLGSFNAPGRLFRVTDVGGFLRIDGCDAQIDNFDEDSTGGQLQPKAE